MNTLKHFTKILHFTQILQNFFTAFANSIILQWLNTTFQSWCKCQHFKAIRKLYKNLHFITRWSSLTIYHVCVEKLLQAAVLQLVTVFGSTGNNNVVETFSLILLPHVFPVCYLFSIVFVSHRRSAWIKKKTFFYQKLIGSPTNPGVDLFLDPVGHFRTPWCRQASFLVHCQNCGILLTLISLGCYNYQSPSPLSNCLAEYPGIMSANSKSNLFYLNLPPHI